MPRYTIEMPQSNGRWFVLGSEETSGAAQSVMDCYRRRFARLPLRVVENPSRALIVCHDPMGEPFAAPLAAGLSPTVLP